MNSSFYMNILASDHVFYKGRAETVILPTHDGEAALLPHHEDCIISIVEGILRFRKEDGTWQDAIVGCGFAQMINNRVTILVDTAEKPEEIDKNGQKKPESGRRNNCVRSRVCRNTIRPRLL